MQNLSARARVFKQGSLSDGDVISKYKFTLLLIAS